jgi:phage major head subunit gpT-like protein
MRPVTPSLLADQFVGHKTNFRTGFAGVSPLWQLIATLVNSSTGTEKYDWLGEWPSIRKWIGDRVIKELSAGTYAIENDDFESTVTVKKKHVEDDTMGMYPPMFQELGRLTAAFPDELIFALLAAGFTTKCYDGQPFFDDEHPVGNNGAVVSNMQDGAGPAWFLLDTSRALKPLIYQERRKFELVALDKPTDQNVVMQNKFIYGIDGRMAVGYGFWQMAYASKADLTPANYEAARAAMGSLKSDEGKPLGISPTLLVFPPALEGKALKILNAETINNETNVWRGTATPMKAPLLAA